MTLEQIAEADHVLAELEEEEAEMASMSAKAVAALTTGLSKAVGG